MGVNVSMGTGIWYRYRVINKDKAAWTPDLHMYRSVGIVTNAL